MELYQIKHVYLIGIGGIGMSALARFFKANGKNVSGYDKTPTSLIDDLIREKISVQFEDDLSKVPAEIKNSSLKENILIIYTPAIPKDHTCLKWFRENNYTVAKRSEVLGMITKNSFTIAVAGTHGKTTTSSIIAHLLIEGGVDCSAFLGGIAKNYNSNLILQKKPGADSKPVVVVEADEYDRSFLTLEPDIAVVTSMDADHLDIYEDKENLEDSYRSFVAKVKIDGVVIYKAGLDLRGSQPDHYTYSITSEADFKAENISIINNRYVFDFTHQGKTFSKLSLGLPGRHNVENALASLAVALQMKILPEKFSDSLQSYQGVKRRFEFHIRKPQITFIDDYAHHPEELRMAISSIKELYPRKKIMGIFQPHLFSRTRDFASEFAKSLSLLDQLILLEIYPAREKPIAGVNSKMIYDKVSLASKFLCSKNNLIDELQNHEVEVVMTFGAGDIDQLVEPIKEMLLKKYL